MAPSTRFASMLPSPAIPLTDTLNIDCTLLLALISNISHVSPQSLRSHERSYHSAILRQVESEDAVPLLPTELYPVLVGRKLICTAHAASRACQIVGTMGTSMERRRASILFGQGVYADMKENELRSALQGTSVHAIPEDLCVSISQLEFGPDAAFQTKCVHFPATIAKRAIEAINMSPINRSVVLYGWCENIVTVSSNQAMAARLRDSIDGVLDDLEQMTSEKNTSVCQKHFQGPRLWICETARSLVGKHKRRENPTGS